MKLNLSTILALLATLGVFAPDIACVASMLASVHVTWLTPVVRALGLLAAFCAALPRIVPKLRPVLALLGLATPPGALAPWVVGKPGEPLIVPLLDGSTVVQVKPPTPGEVPSLPAVAAVSAAPVDLPIGDRLDDTGVFPSEAPTPIRGTPIKPKP